MNWVGLRLERLGFALVTLTITRVRNLCDMFRECCVYKLVVSHLRKLKNAICAQNWPNKSQTARSLTITQPPFLFVCFLGTSLPDPVLTSFKFRPLCTGTVAKSVNAPSLANWTAEMQIKLQVASGESESCIVDQESHIRVRTRRLRRTMTPRTSVLLLLLLFHAHVSNAYSNYGFGRLASQICRVVHCAVTAIQ